MSEPVYDLSKARGVLATEARRAISRNELRFSPIDGSTKDPSVAARGR